jgi:hypothetical protein
MSRRKDLSIGELMLSHPSPLAGEGGETLIERRAG